MFGHLFVVAAVVATSWAGPVWIDGDEYYPGVVMRIGRSPSMAFGYGSGFSSNIGGISHSTGMGASFQSGGGQAYGEGVAGGPAGAAYARGMGVANAAPYPMMYPNSVASVYNEGLARNNYGSAISSAQSFGSGQFGTAMSSAQSHNNLYRIPARYQSAASSAHNLRRLGYESAVSSAQNGGDYASAMSGVHSNNGRGNYGSAVAASENNGNYRGSTAQTMQQRGGALRSSGASSFNAPGMQAAQSHAVNTGDYY